MRSSRTGSTTTVVPNPPRLTTAVPEATVARLPLYHRALTDFAEREVVTVSSDELASAAGVTSAKLRKDLSLLGSYGTRGVGYSVDYLLYQIARELGLTHDWPVVIVGVGNLGRALAHYGGFTSRGFRIVGLFDTDSEKIGEKIGSGVLVEVSPIDDLEAIVSESRAQIGVIATPATAAQHVCDRLVTAGVTSIMNFAPAVVTVTEGVSLRSVDLGLELQVLAFHEQRKVDREQVRS
jgi:redox-sensing transcriptional repressor